MEDALRPRVVWRRIWAAWPMAFLIRRASQDRILNVEDEGSEYRGGRIERACLGDFETTTTNSCYSTENSKGRAEGRVCLLDQAKSKARYRRTQR
jgi:hypothetical protein